MIVPDPSTSKQGGDRALAAELYAATFAGRHDAYSVWVAGPPDHPEDGLWQAIRKPLTGDVVLRAFDTGIPISGYFLNEASATHLAAVDLDLPDGLDLGRRLVARIAAVGGVAYLEPSRRGGHVWIVLDEVRPAVQIRYALRALCLEAHLPTDPGDPEKGRPPDPTKPHPKIELRPGSDRLGLPRPGEPPPLGHCLRMPTMPHPKTGKRYIMLSINGEKLPPKLVELMPTIELCPVAVIEDAAERCPLPEEKPVPPKGLLRPYGEKDRKGAYAESAIKIMQDLWGVQDPLYPGRGFHCPAHPDTNKSAMVHRSDERVICWNPECVLSNGFHGRGTYELTQMAPRRGA